MNKLESYKAVTRQISVSVKPFYLEDESEPDESRYIWAYQIEIENLGPDTVQLQSRHWSIINAYGQTEEVFGDGVVGEQPILEPGDAFEYTSGAPLSTPSGFMRGTYQMTDEKGKSFDIEIPIFSLDSPHDRQLLN